MFDAGLRLCSDSHDQVHIPLPEPSVQRRRVLDEQSGIDIGRNDRQARRERGRIAAYAHTEQELKDSRRRRRVKPSVRPSPKGAKGERVDDGGISASASSAPLVIPNRQL